MGANVDLALKVDASVANTTMTKTSMLQAKKVAEAESLNEVNTQKNTNEMNAALESTKTNVVQQRQEAQNKIDAANKKKLDDIKKLKQEEKEDTEQLEETVQSLNTIKNLGLSFVIDKEHDVTLVTVVDKNTDETIRQIPSEEFLRISKSLTKYRDSIDEVSAKLGSFNDKISKELKGIILDSNA